jgi:probable F420-dependent oxidoreductase
MTGADETVRMSVIFPQIELGQDSDAVVRFCTGVEKLGYARIVLYDHILGVDRAVQPDFDGLYDIDSTFREPFVLLGFLAAATSVIELATGVLVSPQRQTPLVAKQAAEVDLLSNGRLVLGLGAGWNEAEFQGLGADFGHRGALLDEQIVVLRALWSNRSVTLHGHSHDLRGVGIAPRPLRDIPIWLGARSGPAYRRVGRLADGWFPRVSPGPKFDEARREVAAGAAAAGREPGDVTMDCRVAWNLGESAFLAIASAWKALGARYLSLDTMGAGLRTADEHLEAAARAAKLLRSL